MNSMTNKTTIKIVQFAVIIFEIKKEAKRVKERPQNMPVFGTSIFETFFMPNGYL